MLRNKLVLSTLIGLLILTAISLIVYYLYRSYWPRELTFAVSDSDQGFAESLANILEDVDPPIYLKIVPTPSEDVPAVVQSEAADLGIIQLDENSFSEIRVVVLIYPEVFFLVVHRNSDIRSPTDLVGKVVTVRETDQEILKSILKYYGVQENHVEIRYLTSDEAHSAFVNREVDAAIRWSEPNSDRVKKLIQEGQGRLIPFDQFESMRLMIPHFAEYILPQGVSQAGNPVVPAGDFETVGTYRTLIANVNVDPAIIRTITQAVFENQNTIVADFPLAVYMRSPATVQMVGPAIHPGAQAYFDKDKPTFFQQYASEIAFFFSAGPILVSILIAFWAKIQNKHQVHAKMHIQSVHNALIALGQSEDRQNAEMIERRLLRIRALFTKDLKEGNISSEDTQAFSMIWDKAITMTRERKKLPDLSTDYLEQE